MAWSAIVKPVAAISTVSVTMLAILRQKSQKARYYINLSLYLGSLLSVSIFALGIGVFLSCIGQRYNTQHVVARAFYRMTSPLIGIRFEVEGREHLENLKSPVVMVGNHQSFLDILYLGCIFPKRASIMAKKELSFTPFLGWWMSISGAIWIDRKRSKSAVKVMGQAGKDMKKKGMSVFVFPEGTRSNTPEHSLLPFKKGAFHLAIETQAPIIPIVVENYNRLFDGKTRLDGGVIRIRVLPPIPTNTLTATDATDLTEKTRALMLHTLQEISASRTSAVAASSPSPSSSASTSSAAVTLPTPSSPEVQPLLKDALSSITSTTPGAANSYGATTSAASSSAAVSTTERRQGTASLDGAEAGEVFGKGAVLGSGIADKVASATPTDQSD